MFYYTLAVMLISILTASICLSAYLVSHQRIAFFAFLAFFFYFFDVALVFLDDFITQNTELSASSVYNVGNPAASILFGACVLQTFWLMVTEYVGRPPWFVRVAPGLLFAIVSGVTLFLVPEGNVQEFSFYTARSAMLFWILLYCAFRYVSAQDAIERSRLRRCRFIYGLACVLGLTVLGENIVFLLLLAPATLVGGSGVLPFLPERNFAENILVICCAFFASRFSCKELALRYEKPPCRQDDALEAHLNRSLPVYCRRYGLSERESEVLLLVLTGNDNQNIASAKCLALSTVKVHVHHILKKTGQANRQELTRDFWKSI